jgi:competence protein ComEA
MAEEPTPRRSLLVLCSVLSLIAGGAIGFFTPHPRSQPIAVITPDPTPTPGMLRVYVCGAVVAPAVYELPPGSLIRDAVKAAGGPSPQADLERINLAQQVSDQQQVTVPRRDEASVAASPALTPAATLLDVNTAGVADLERLPGIGPITAQQIVEYRQAHGPFSSPEDLLRVPGIGPATLEKLRPWITVG